MKVAIVGSRDITAINVADYVSRDDEIVSGGARGIDTCAEKYARTHGLRLTVFFPDYEKYGKGAPLRRNHDIVQYADCVYAFWDGVSRGTSYTVELAKPYGKPVHVFQLIDGRFQEVFTSFTLL